MKPEEIHLTDWMRILVGEVPASFYIELIIRATVIYFLLMFSLRLMGKRMSSQLSRNDLTAMVSLAAAIGVPLQSPDRGLIPTVIIALIVIFIARWIGARSFKNQEFEKFSQGNIGLLVKDPVMDLQTMKVARLSRERLVAELRSNSIKHLGAVKRLYMEAGGSFTLIEEEEPKPGLSILPTWDKGFYARFKESKDVLVCSSCGLAQKLPFDTNRKCSNCNEVGWVPGVQ